MRDATLVMLVRGDPPQELLLGMKKARFGAGKYNGFGGKVEPGETIAIVGQTGSGKTSLTRLINRIYDVSEGRVLVDGVDVRDWNMASLRSQISTIEQDIFLFARSIADNISFGLGQEVDGQVVGEESEKRGEWHRVTYGAETDASADLVLAGISESRWLVRVLVIGVDEDLRPLGGLVIPGIGRLDLDEPPAFLGHLDRLGE